MMSGEELQRARRKFGMTGRDFAKAFDVTERTLRGWETGERGGRSVRVPRLVAILVRRALKDASIRRELGLNAQKLLSERRSETAPTG